MICLRFSISVAILSILISSQNVNGSKLANTGMRLRSSFTPKDTENFFKHDALIKSYIDSNNPSLCTGSIIDDLHILTAAHCVVKTGSTDIISALIEVAVGITQVHNGQMEYQTIRAVETVFLPVGYVSYSDNNYLKYTYGDIAVLRLNYRLGLGVNPNIEALKLPVLQQPQGNYYTGQTLMYTGFGITGTEVKVNPYDWATNTITQLPAHYLHYSFARVLKDGECFSNVPSHHADLKICARLINSDRSQTCGGDSGGPLFDARTKVVVGVVSIGTKACGDNTPTTYTKVVAFIDGINAAIRGQALPSSWRSGSYGNDPIYQRFINSKRQFREIYDGRSVIYIY